MADRAEAGVTARPGRHRGRPGRRSGARAGASDAPDLGPTGLRLLERLAAVPLIDQHCHSISADWQNAAAEPPAWRRCFTEAGRPDSLLRDVPAMGGYREFLAAFGRYLTGPRRTRVPVPEHGRGLAGDAATLAADGEAALAAQRDARAVGPDYVRDLLDDAGIGALLIDTGFQGRGSRPVLAPENLEALAGRPVRAIARLERLAEGVLAEPRNTATLSRFDEAVQAAIEGAIDAGAVALKSVAAYRSGFALPEPSTSALKRALAHRTVQARRIDDPAIEAHLVRIAIVVAARRRVPLQFHTGFGDEDLELAGADPSLLRPILQHADAEGVPVIMLHCYPFVGQAAYLASLFPNAHMDLSLTIPLLGSAAARACLSEALGLCPFTKLLAGSDGHTLPEMHWRGGRLWREALAAVLGADVDGGRLDLAGAEQIGAAVLSGNARRLYAI